MLGVEPIPATGPLIRVIGDPQSRLGEYFVYPRPPGFEIWPRELGGVPPQRVDGALGPAVGFLRAVTETDQPAAGELVVIDSLLSGSCSYSGQRLIVGVREILPNEPLVDIEEELANDGLGEVAVRLLDEQEVEELTLASSHGEVILGPPFALDPSCVRVEDAGHPEMVESDIAECDVDLEIGGAGNPLPQALGQNHVVVGVRHDGPDTRVDLD